MYITTAMMHSHPEKATPFAYLHARILREGGGEGDFAQDNFAKVKFCFLHHFQQNTALLACLLSLK
jgi:hypothetical protein